MGQSKIVPQGAQNIIKQAVGLTMQDKNPDFKWDDKEGKLTTGAYEVLMCVIPKQSEHHSEVRNG